MLDIQFIRDNPQKLKEICQNKNKDPKNVDRVLELDLKRRQLLQDVQALRSEKNKLTRDDIQKGKDLKQKLKDLEPQLKEIEEAYLQVLSLIPNIYSSDTPIGKDESENVILETWGEPTEFDFKPKDHLELGEKLNIIDTKMAAKITGARFAYIKGDGALLQFAIIQHTIKTLTDPKTIKQIADSVAIGYNAKPFCVVVPPVMINPEIFDRMDRLKPEDERFYIQSDDKYLIGSAEHTLGPLHMDQMLSEKDLPIRYLGYSTSFRREAGSYGKDTRGILRVHQFDKLEMESFTTSETSTDEQNFMVAIQEYLVRSLEIPYQKISICTGDMGKPDFRQVDLNCWIPSQNKYRETHTSDLMTDYQARRLSTKVKRKGGMTEFVHMNDATAFAIGRILIAIIENYQQEDGSIKVPLVLQPYLERMLSMGSETEAKGSKLVEKSINVGLGLGALFLGTKLLSQGTPVGLGLAGLCGIIGLDQLSRV